jgi:hypothetical protein
MASSFVHAPGFDRSGTAVETWLVHNWDAAKFTAEGAPLVNCADGTSNPVKDCAVVFRNFRSAAGSYFADPVAIVPYRAAMLTAIEGDGKFSHPVVKKDDVLVPLGTPDWSCTRTRIVLQQSARQWVSGGKNTADMSDDHVITLYYAALQSLVFHGGNTTSAEGQAMWFPALVALTRAFAAVHAAFPSARRITAALVLTPGVNDMIQKGLAYAFHSEALWTAESQLNMLTVAIRRNLRHSSSTLVALAPGPFVLFVLVPLLRDVAHTAESAETLLARFNAAAADLLRGFSADLAAPGPVNARLLVTLTRQMGTPLTLEQAAKLLAHTTTTDVSIEPPWATWGVLPAPPEVRPHVVVDRFAVAGRDPGTHCAHMKALDPDHFQAFSFKGVEWAAIGFKTPGTYIVMPGDLGIAERAVGDSRGRELTANWRLTAGYDVLPRDREGYSLAGQQHVRLPPRTYGANSWTYRAGAPLSLETPFLVEVEPTRITLKQTGRVFFSMAKGGREPALLAFKNLWLDVHYKPAERPVATVSAGAAAASHQRATLGPPKTWAEAASRGVPTAGLSMLRTTNRFAAISVDE